MTLASLWSGGLDSTIATYYYSLFSIDNIQPYHILIRNGGGKDAREREAIDKIYESLKFKFLNVLPVIRAKHKIPPSDNRNEDLINFIKNKYNISKVILGLHKIDRDVSEDFKNDIDHRHLSKTTGVKVYDLTQKGWLLKRHQFVLGAEKLGLDILKMTWSCQLWWKQPCGKCFSCRERENLFKKYGENNGL